MYSPFRQSFREKSGLLAITRSEVERLYPRLLYVDASQQFLIEFRVQAGYIYSNTSFLTLPRYCSDLILYLGELVLN